MRAPLGRARRANATAAFRQCPGREQLGVDLVAHLQDVAPIDEDRRLVLQNHGEARRARKTGQPGEPLVAFGDIFVLVLVGARRKKSVEVLPRESRAQRLEAGAAGPAFVRVGEGLGVCFEHHARLVRPRAGSKLRYGVRGKSAPQKEAAPMAPLPLVRSFEANDQRLYARSPWSVMSRPSRSWSGAGRRPIVRSTIL